MAASASFMTPISHPANILVTGPGGYRFVDYLKLGVPLTLVVFAVILLVLPQLWPPNPVKTHMDFWQISSVWDVISYQRRELSDPEVEERWESEALQKWVRHLKLFVFSQLKNLFVLSGRDIVELV